MYSKLKKMREKNGLSQSELSKLSGVGLRSIQMYEQGQRDINKAQVAVVLKLAEVLECKVEDLIQRREK